MTKYLKKNQINEMGYEKKISKPQKKNDKANIIS